MSTDPSTGQPTTSWPATKTGLSPDTEPGPVPSMVPGPEPCLRPGEYLGDFHLVRELGRGSFAQVFLARQLSWDRDVALKVSKDVSQEARNLAKLEHPNIVQVFAEAVDRQWSLRLLWMQYVDGDSLYRVLRALTGTPLAQRDGPRLLEAIAAGAPTPEAFVSMEEAPLASCDAVETVCWLGARLAEALAFAHSRGVLHRDLKPANVLLDRRGNPLLADFNLAARAGRSGNPCGGTPAYMAPEHREAFAGRASPESVDARSDLYSLGLVLNELLTGARPGGKDPAPACVEQAVPAVLDRTVRRCLEPDPGQRYQTAVELARALEGCRQWQWSRRHLPAESVLTRLTGRNPPLFAVLLPALPHLVAATLVILFNLAWLAASPYPEAGRWGTLFVGLGASYTVLALLGTGLTAWRVGGPLWRSWKEGADGADPATLARRRKEALGVTRLAMALSVLGWLPGTILIPATLAAVAGPAVGLHLLVSFLAGGLLASTYSSYLGLMQVLRVGYARLWGDAQGFWTTARVELAGVQRQLRVLQLLACLTPLVAGTALLASPGDEAYAAVTRGLLLGLIVLSMLGTALALLLHAYAQHALAALTGTATSAPNRR